MSSKTSKHPAAAKCPVRHPLKNLGKPVRRWLSNWWFVLCFSRQSRVFFLSIVWLTYNFNNSFLLSVTRCQAWWLQEGIHVWWRGEGGGGRCRGCCCCCWRTQAMISSSSILSGGEKCELQWHSWCHGHRKSCNRCLSSREGHFSLGTAFLKCLCRVLRLSCLHAHLTSKVSTCLKPPCI